MDRINLKMAKKDYSVLGLRNNPFPYTGVPENAPEVYYDQVEVINAVNNLLDIIISTGKSNHLIITGAYGNGKSHTLRYIQSEITTLSANHEVKVCVGYVSQPGESFLDIYRSSYMILDMTS